MGLPHKLKNMNLFIDGVTHIGRVVEVTLPKLALKTDEYRGGGMLAPVLIDMGLEKLELDFTGGGMLTTPLGQFGAAVHDAAQLRFAGAYQSDDTGQVRAVEVAVRGRYTEIDNGNQKPGDGADHKYKVAVSYYRYSIDGLPRVEIDVIAGIFIVDGIDRYAEIRAAIGA